jgi:GT2 family glycosyltransferase
VPYLQHCLSSVLGTDYPDFEIIVVDNGSTDNSAELVETTFSQVRLIRIERNRGLGAANNLGATWAEGEVLAFLNPDTVVEPGWLGPLVQALDTDSRTGLATAKILLMERRDRINTCGNDVHYTGLTMCHGMGWHRTAFDRPEEVAAVSGAAFAVRRDVFQALGGFDEDFFLYMEDTDLSLRARLAGWRCLFVPHSVVYHDYRLRFGPNKTYYQERNRYLMLLKTLRGRTLLALAPALLLAEFVTWGHALLRQRGQWRDKLDAYRWVIAYRKRIAAARTRVQARRQIDDSALLRLSSYRLAYEQTGDDWISRAAHWAFDPLFRGWRWLVLNAFRI